MKISFCSISSEVHYCICTFLTANEKNFVSQVNQELRRVYQPESWKHCFVSLNVNDLKKLSKNAYSSMKFVSLNVFLNPELHEWFPTHYIHRATISIFGHQYTKLLRHSIDVKKYPFLKFLEFIPIMNLEKLTDFSSSKLFLDFFLCDRSVTGLGTQVHITLPSLQSFLQCSPTFQMISKMEFIWFPNLDQLDVFFNRENPQPFKMPVLPNLKKLKIHRVRPCFFELIVKSLSLCPYLIDVTTTHYYYYNDGDDAETPEMIDKSIMNLKYFSPEIEKCQATLVGVPASENIHLINATEIESISVINEDYFAFNTLDEEIPNREDISNNNNNNIVLLPQVTELRIPSELNFEKFIKKFSFPRVSNFSVPVLAKYEMTIIAPKSEAIFENITILGLEINHLESSFRFLQCLERFTGLRELKIIDCISFQDSPYNYSDIPTAYGYLNWFYRNYQISESNFDEDYNDNKLSLFFKRFTIDELKEVVFYNTPKLRKGRDDGIVWILLDMIQNPLDNVKKIYDFAQSDLYAHILNSYVWECIFQVIGLFKNLEFLTIKMNHRYIFSPRFKKLQNEKRFNLDIETLNMY